MVIGNRKCPSCGKFFKPDTEPYVLEEVGKMKGRYFHETCYGKTQALVSREASAKERLIKELRLSLGIPEGSATPQNILLMLNKYNRDNDYKFSGMLGTILYLKNVKGIKITGVGIIPHTYDEARKYYEGIKQNSERIESFEGDAVVFETLNIPRPKGRIKLNKTRKEIDLGEI